MASATATTHRRRPPQSNLGRPLRKEEQRHAAPRPAAASEAPWSDEERKAAGLAPIGEGPGTPRQQAERSRANNERKARFEHEEAEDKAQRRKDFYSRQRREVRQGASSAASSAGSGLKGLVTGKGGGTIAGTVFGLVLYAMGVALLNGGPKELAGWLGAKFVNKPYVPAAAAKTPLASGKGTLVSMVVPASSGSPASIVAA